MKIELKLNMIVFLMAEANILSKEFETQICY